MGSKGKILVVDDDRLVLAMVVHGLAQAGYEVIDADNGDEAILLARQHRPDLALLDIRMDGKSGFDVAEYLRDVVHTPFVFLSAFSDEATVARIQALGALAYLVKPLEVGQIVPAIDAAFARALELRAKPAQGAASPPPAPVQAGDAGDALRDTVSLAVGVVMHRFSLNRADALARLRRQAGAEGRSLQAQAERIVQAVEDLAGGADA
ncbi:MAG: ANTAR domain-containing response regulator [Rubrivivax sp.]